jgi:hypothetical protein
MGKMLGYLAFIGMGITVYVLYKKAKESKKPKVTQ